MRYSSAMHVVKLFKSNLECFGHAIFVISIFVRKFYDNLDDVMITKELFVPMDISFYSKKKIIKI